MPGDLLNNVPSWLITAAFGAGGMVVGLAVLKQTIKELKLTVNQHTTKLETVPKLEEKIKGCKEILDEHCEVLYLMPKPQDLFTDKNHSGIHKDNMRELKENYLELKFEQINDQIINNRDLVMAKFEEGDRRMSDSTKAISSLSGELKDLNRNIIGIFKKNGWVKE